jgi:hypothetical protein
MVQIGGDDTHPRPDFGTAHAWKLPRRQHLFPCKFQFQRKRDQQLRVPWLSLRLLSKDIHCEKTLFPKLSNMLFW